MPLSISSTLQAVAIIGSNSTIRCEQRDPCESPRLECDHSAVLAATGSSVASPWCPSPRLRTLVKRSQGSKTNAKLATLSSERDASQSGYRSIFDQGPNHGPSEHSNNSVV